MADKFFPFTVYAPNESGGPYEFREAFDANRPETYEVVETWGTYEHRSMRKFTYFGYDVIVLSATEVEFVCYSILDTCYGGRGDLFHRFKAKVNKSVTTPAINRRLVSRAVDRRDEELRQAELLIIKAYANEEKLALGLSTATHGAIK